MTFFESRDAPGIHQKGHEKGYRTVITPFRDLAGADRYPILVQALLERGFTDRQMEKILGANFLRALALLRPR